MKKKIAELRVADLRHELEKRGLDSKGLKGALVQRLQKAVVEEGFDPNELELSVMDVTPSKATGRRSVGRGKRSMGTGSESEEVKDSIPQIVENSEIILPPELKDDVLEEEDPGDHKNGVTEGNPDVSFDSQVESTQLNDDNDNETHPMEEEDPTDDVRDVTPTRDEEGDEGSAEQYYVDENDQPGNEEETEGYEDVAECDIDDDAHVEYEEEAGNDFQHDENNPDYQVEEEMEEDEYGQEANADDGEIVYEEMAGHEESGAGDAVEEDYNEVDETGIAATEVQEEMINENEKMEGSQHESPQDVPVETLSETPATTGPEILDDDKPESQAKVEHAGKEEVTSSEVDVLDMLDYDLELTGEQNNINTQQDEQAAKNVAVKTVKGDTASINTEEITTSDDHRSHPKPDSSKPSSVESARAGSQSSTKSATTTANDSGKTSASGKRETSVLSKEENINRNLWISGLSSTTRASELKAAFSRYGKVVGAKVVTNVKSPGSKCFGYVTMATADAASKCILHLNNTDMHGRMITVEIAKGDPSASSKKSSTTLPRKESETKVSAKSKDGDSGSTGSSSRRQSLGQAKDGDGKDGQDSTKKVQDGKPVQAVRRTGDDDRPSGGRSPSRSRPDRGPGLGGVRVGEKRHSNRSPVHNRSASRIEPERKRMRPLDAADRKVVMDSNKGELRVNVSRTGGRPSGGARWEGDQKPKPLLSRRRSSSPIRRRSYSPLRSSRGGRGRGRGGIMRTSGTYGDRTVTRPGPRRDGHVLTMSQIRAQNRDRGRIQDRSGRGGVSRRDISADRERLRRERDERERLRIERERLERERRQLEKDRQERERLEAERLRLEQERKRELERIEREKAEMRRLQEITRYEVEQRQRAIKRTYDEDSGHRISRGSRDAIPVKRSGDRGGGRPEVRREREDNRRSYGSFNSRNSGQRNGPSNEPPPPGTMDYRSRQQGSSRDSGNTSKLSTYHDNRGRPQDRDDSRYGSESRTVDKYDRRSSGNAGSSRSMDYHQSASFDRTGSDAHRRGAPTRDSRDGRKVVRERPNARGGSPPEYRRQSNGRSNATARIELTREQSPPVRRLRREASPPAVSRNSNWRDGGKSTRDTTRRGDDRDLREQLRGGRQENYSESNRGQRRGSRSPNRNTSQYSSTRWPDNNNGSSSTSQQAYSASNDGSAIPTTGRSSGSANWSQQWAQNAWGGATMQSASTVNRQVIPPYGTVPSQSAMTPGSNLIPTGQGYVTSGSDRQSRSFQGSSYNKQPIQRRF